MARLSGGKKRPTSVLASQLVTTAMEVAVGRPDAANSSVTRNLIQCTFFITDLILNNEIIKELKCANTATVS